jgi:hypothetical protein
LLTLAFLLCGCRTAQPLDSEALQADKIAMASRSFVRPVIMAVAFGIENGSFYATGDDVAIGAAVVLSDTAFLSAAHVVPDSAQATMQLRRNEETNGYEFTGWGAGMPFKLFTNRERLDARVVASDHGAYIDPKKDRYEAAPDWALIETSSTRQGDPSVRAWATPVLGEACYVVGFPAGYISTAAMDVTNAHGDMLTAGWLQEDALVFRGTVVANKPSGIRVRFDGQRLIEGRGLSGGGTFVERDGEPALLGINALGNNLTGTVWLSAVPEQVKVRLEYAPDPG